MKRKREAKEEGCQICELGSVWASKRRAPAEDQGRLSELGQEYMSSRPSVRRHLYAFQNGDSLITRSDPVSRYSSRNPTSGDADEDEEDWISQIGAQYMTRKKLYEERPPLSSCSGYYSEREHELELDNELDDCWIADYGMEWMRRRCRTRRGQYKVHDDAWICELGYQWMSKVREREAANQAWLTDLSSLYITRRRREIDSGTDEFGSRRTALLRSSGDDKNCIEFATPWETRRKLDYADLGSELHKKRTENGHGPHPTVAEAEPADKCKGDSSTRLQTVELTPLGELEAVPADNGVMSAGNGVEVLDAVSSRDTEPESEIKDDRHCSNRPQVVDSMPSKDLDLEPKDNDELSDEFQVLESNPLRDSDSAAFVELDSSSSSS